MAIKKVNELTDIGSIADGDKLVGERVDGTTVRISYAVPDLPDLDELDDSTTTNKFTTAEDISKLAGVEELADVTDATNVVSSLDSATPATVTPVAADKVLIKDDSDSDKLKLATAQDIADLYNISDQFFSVYNNSDQSIAHNVAVLVTLSTELEDTDSSFDSTTNYRHTPQVPGKYVYFGAVLLRTVTDGTIARAILYKNGNSLFSGPFLNSSGAARIGTSVSAIVDMNGTTDYIDLRVLHQSGGTVNTNGGADTVYLIGGRIGP